MTERELRLGNRRRSCHAWPVVLALLALPLLFCASAGWLLYSSLAYTGVGALAGVGVLLAGGVVLAWSVQREKTGA